MVGGMGGGAGRRALRPVLHCPPTGTHPSHPPSRFNPPLTPIQMERACDLCHITLNKNAVVGDVSAMAPGGVRIGAPAMTSRGLKEADFEAIADMLHDVLTICKDVQASSGRLLKDFNRGLDGDARIKAMRAKVEAFAAAFAMPGFSVQGLAA